MGVASTTRTYLHSHGSYREPTFTRRSHRQHTEISGPYDERCHERAERGHRRSFFTGQNGNHVTSHYTCRECDVSDISTQPWIAQRVKLHAMISSGARTRGTQSRTLCMPCYASMATSLLAAISWPQRPPARRGYLVDHLFSYSPASTTSTGLRAHYHAASPWTCSAMPHATA